MEIGKVLKGYVCGVQGGEGFGQERGMGSAAFKEKVLLQCGEWVGKGQAGGPDPQGICYGGVELGRWEQKDWDRVMRYV